MRDDAARRVFLPLHGRRVASATTASSGALRGLRAPTIPESTMNDDAFNLSIRKFLKMVGVSSQREIEQAVGAAVKEGRISGNESFPVRMTLEMEGVKLRVVFDGTIELT